MLKNQVEIYNSDELSLFFRTKIIVSMIDASFSDVFPMQTLEDISAFSKEAISEGENKIVLSLLTESKGLVSFMYEITSTNKGINISPAIGIHVPKKKADRTIPSSFIDYPNMAIDVSTTGL